MVREVARNSKLTNRQSSLAQCKAPASGPPPTCLVYRRCDHTTEVLVGVPPLLSLLY